MKDCFANNEELCGKGGNYLSDKFEATKEEIKGFFKILPLVFPNHSIPKISIQSKEYDVVFWIKPVLREPIANLRVDTLSNYQVTL